VATTLSPFLRRHSLWLSISSLQYSSPPLSFRLNHIRPSHAPSSQLSRRNGVWNSIIVLQLLMSILISIRRHGCQKIHPFYFLNNSVKNFVLCLSLCTMDTSYVSAEVAHLQVLHNITNVSKIIWEWNCLLHCW